MYIGPYIKTLKHKTIDSVKSYRECVNDSCDYHGKVRASKFCGFCGHAIGVVTKQESSDVSAYDLLVGKFDNFEGLYEPEYTNNILLPNSRTAFDLKHSNDLIDIKNIDTVSHVNWMCEEYKDQITFLREELGNENVIVGYGVIVSY